MPVFTPDVMTFKNESEQFKIDVKVGSRDLRVDLR